MISQQKADFIRSLADANGHIEPSVVIEAARSFDSPIHEDFEWDLETAARQTWLDQARILIRYVRLEVVVKRETIIAPYYIVDPDRAPKSQTYMTLTNAIGQREKALRILDDELDRIKSAVERARVVALVLGVDGDLTAMLTGVGLIAAKAHERPTKPGRGGRGGAGGRKRPPKSQGYSQAAE